MAIKFLSNVDIQGSLTLNDNQLTNFVVENLAANPSFANSFVGRLYYNNSATPGTLKVCVEKNVGTSTATYVSLDSTDGVNTFTNTNGTYVSAGTQNATAVGAVTMGTLDLSAADGSNTGNTQRFLTKANTWAVPAYTTNSEGVTSVTGTAPIASSGGTTPDISISNFGGADGTNPGSKGAVPAPVATDNVKFLRGDGTFATPSGSYSSWIISSDGVSGTNTVSDGETAKFDGGTKITTATVDRTTTFTHDDQAQSNTTATATLTSAGTFTALADNITIDGTGHVTAQVLTTFTMPTSDNYSSWTLAGNSGTSQTISSGDTATISGGTNITTSAGATDTLTVDLDNSITLSGDLTVQGGDVTLSAVPSTVTIKNDEASALTFSSSGAANVLKLNTTATPGVDITGLLTVSALATLTTGFSAGAESAMGSNKITGLADGAASTDAVNLGQVQALVAGVGIFRGGYNANTGLTTDLGAGNGAINGASNIASDLGDFYAVTTAGTQIGVALETGDLIFANTTIAASSSPANSAFTVVQAGQSIATAAANDNAAVKGIAGFDSANFSVTSNGFVTLDDVALGTDTSGDYTESVAASAVDNRKGIAVSGATGEGQDAVVGIDITGQTDIGASVADADEFLVYDASAAENKKVAYSAIASSVHDSGKYTDTFPNTVTNTWTVTHSLGTVNVLVQTWLDATGQAVYIDFVRDDANNVTFTASANQAVDTIRVLVTK